LSNFNLIVGVTKKEEIYPNVDILLSLSSGFESFGLTIVEAMSHRVPVIVPSSMGPKEILDTCEGLNVGCVLNKIEVNEVLIAIDRVLSNKSLYTDGPIAVDKNFSLSKNTLKFLSKINRNI
jgi:glycosyltransferase involved in cell wall biosynthesis